MRLIDADALEKDLAKRWDVNDDTDFANKEVWRALRETPTIDAVPHWIPCEERLPEPKVAVLGYAPAFQNIFAVYYDSVCGWMTWCPACYEPFPSSQGEIVAWMPLPKPYEGEREDND